MIHTIWKYGIAFGKDMDECRSKSGCEIECDYMYMGLIDNIPEDVACEVAELHPNCIGYNADALMALYKLYNNNGGTESPKLAISSKRTRKEINTDMNYIVIWNLIE